MRAPAVHTETLLLLAFFSLSLLLLWLRPSLTLPPLFLWLRLVLLVWSRWTSQRVLAEKSGSFASKTEEFPTLGGSKAPSPVTVYVLDPFHLHNPVHIRPPSHCRTPFPAFSLPFPCINSNTRLKLPPDLTFLCVFLLCLTTGPRVRRVRGAV